MRGNEYWDLAENDGLLLGQFNIDGWQVALAKSFKELSFCLNKFKKCESKDNYMAIGSAVQKANTVCNVIYHIPLFIDGCDESERKVLEENTSKKINTFMVKIRKDVEPYLNSLINKGGKESSWAKKELMYWRIFSPKISMALKIDNKVQSEENPFLVEKLDLYDFDMKVKYKKSAEKKGFKGFLIDARDNNLSSVMAWQSNESVREFIWDNMLEHVPKDKDIQKSIKARKNVACECGFDSYLSYVDQFSAGLKLKTVAQKARGEMAKMAKDYTSLKTNLCMRGMDNYDEYEIDFEKPWNEDYLIYNGYEGDSLDIDGSEFSLQRILDFIIPDLLGVGGWSVVGEIEKIGHGERCLYLYSIEKNEEKAYFYFAPYPHANHKDTDQTAAYATIIREKWNGAGQETPAITLVAQNFNLKNGYLTELTDLTYLAHEMGHILHFLSFEGKNFGEYNRMAQNLSELPSLVLEQIASQPETLAKWCGESDKYKKSSAYWQRRVRPDKASLLEYFEFLENIWMDSMAHSEYDKSLGDIQKNLYKKIKLPMILEKDPRVNINFDFTEIGCYSSTYFVGRVVSTQLIGEFSDKNIRHALSNLLDNVLTHTHDGVGYAWKRTYGESVKSTFDKGLGKVRNTHINRAREFYTEK